MAHPAAFTDLVIPHLYGNAWFEKPPLLYWTTALATRFGLRDEWAARFPVALESVFFLVFFYWTLAREFSRDIALFATVILATSAGWLAYSFEGITDLPMSTALGAAILLSLTGKESRKQGVMAGAMLGLAVLAKALVPLVLFAPVFYLARGRRIGIAVGAAVVAAPWFAIATVLYGTTFLRELIWKQHFARFFTPSLQHVQPFWYYVPVILAGLFPWILIPATLFSKRLWIDRRLRFLGAWFLYGLVFFSASQNKLPGYVLPLLPAIAVMLAVALEQSKQVEWWLAASVLLLCTLPVIAAALPQVLLSGIRHSEFKFAFGWPFLLLAIALLVIRKPVIRRPVGRQLNLSIIFAGLCVAAGGMYLKNRAVPALDQRVSVRQFFLNHAAEIRAGCFDPGVRREWQYGLSYYAQEVLPECGPQASRARIIVRGAELKMQQ